MFPKKEQVNLIYFNNLGEKLLGFIEKGNLFGIGKQPVTKFGQVKLVFKFCLMIIIVVTIWVILAADQMAFRILRHRRKDVLSMFKGQSSIFCNLNLAKLPSKFIDDDEIVLAAVQHEKENFYYCSERLKDYKKFVLSVLSRHPILFPRISKRLQEDKEIALAVVRRRGRELFLLNKRFQMDKELALAAITNDVDILRDLDGKFKADQEAIALAFRIKKDSFKYASTSLTKDKEFLKNQLALDEKGIFRYCHYDLRRTKGIYIPALKKDPALCKLFSPGLLLKLDFSSLPKRNKKVIYEAYKKRTKEKDIFLLAKAKQHFLS